MCKEKIFQLQSISYAIKCHSIDKRFAVENSGIFGLALIFNLNNLRTTILYARNQFKVLTSDESYTVSFCRSIQTHGVWSHGLMVKVRRSE